MTEHSRLKNGFGGLNPGETPTAQSLWVAVGKTRGLIESLAPGVGFLVAYTLTEDVLISVSAPIALALVFIGARALQRSPVLPAVAGLVGIGASAGIALWSGRAEDNFLLGFLVNGLWVVGLLLSLVIRRPLVGFFAGFLAGDSLWRTKKGSLKVAYVATWLWLGVFAGRLAIQVPLYLAGSVGALATAKLMMGLPLYAAALWVTWLLYRAVYGPQQEDAR